MNKDLPILVKVAPDLSDSELNDIAQVLTRKDVRIILKNLNSNFNFNIRKVLME